MTFTCCDICDANEDKLQNGQLRILPPMFQQYGQYTAFCGPAKTIKVHEENVQVRAALETPGLGRVLVVDGGGSMVCALLGGNLAKLAEKNGWAGVVVNGCVRDVAEINACRIGVRALASHPQKSGKRGDGQEDIALTIADVHIAPGAWIYADADGVLVADFALHQ